MSKRGAVISCVVPESIAHQLEVEPGDRLVKINGQVLEDLIDYRFMLSDESLEVELEKANGEEWVLEVEKELDEDLGLEFEQSTFDGIKRCANKCLFCFVDQMPPETRDTLHVKDDDYRMSFLHGNFITFTNVGEAELNRIIRLRLSPLYVSVHTTHPRLREKMLNSRQAGAILSQLTKLTEAGIEIHTQIVATPELNDGMELERTLRELGGLYPGVQSIAVVPVGLTGYREGLYPLRLFAPEEAALLIKQVENFQLQFQAKFGRYLVYAADEFYLLANQAIPPAEYYEDFPQTENGIGLIRLFLDSFNLEKSKLPASMDQTIQLLLVTGKSAKKVLTNLAKELEQVNKLKVEVISVPNRFFGETVTVAGLVTGQDIAYTLANHLAADANLKANAEANANANANANSVICIPSVMLKAGEEVFLDGMTLNELANQLGRPIRIIDLTPQADDLIELILEHSLNRQE
jgi:putative radical SAM enzyme (TIGR03279 family)